MKNDDDATVQPAVGTPVERKLGHLPPQAAGQAHMMSVCIPGQRDHGHWYSPDAVRELVYAERERCAAICDQRSADHWHDYKDRASPFRGNARTEAMSDEAEECAKLIRGPNA